MWRTIKHGGLVRAITTATTTNRQHAACATGKHPIIHCSSPPVKLQHPWGIQYTHRNKLKLQPQKKTTTTTQKLKPEMNGLHYPWCFGWLIIYMTMSGNPKVNKQKCWVHLRSTRAVRKHFGVMATNQVTRFSRNQPITAHSEFTQPIGITLNSHKSLTKMSLLIHANQ